MSEKANNDMYTVGPMDTDVRHALTLAALGVATCSTDDSLDEHPGASGRSNSNGGRAETVAQRPRSWKPKGSLPLRDSAK